MSAPRLSNRLIAAVDSSGGGTPLSALVNAFGNAALAQINQNTVGVTASGGFASAWADARGAGFGSAWAFTGTAQPSYTQNAQGIWVLTFDGVNDGSDHNAGLASVFRNIGTGFAYVVAATVGTPAGSVVPLFVSGGNLASAARLVVQRNVSGATADGTLRPVDGGTSKAIDGGVSDGVLRDDLFVFDLPNGATRLYQGGVLTVQNAAAFTAGTLISDTASLSVKLGKANTTGFFPGPVSSVILGTVVPTPTQIAVLHTFGVTAAGALQ